MVKLLFIINDVIKNLIPERKSIRDKKYLSKPSLIFKLPPTIVEGIETNRIGIKKLTNIFFFKWPSPQNLIEFNVDTAKFKIKAVGLISETGSLNITIQAI